MGKYTNEVKSYILNALVRKSRVPGTDGRMRARRMFVWRAKNGAEVIGPMDNFVAHLTEHFNQTFHRAYIDKMLVDEGYRIVARARRKTSKLLPTLKRKYLSPAQGGNGVIRAQSKVPPLGTAQRIELVGNDIIITDRQTRVYITMLPSSGVALKVQSIQ